MISLTNATKVFIKHYTKQLNSCKTKETQKFITHKIRHTYAVLHNTQKIIIFEKDKFDKKLSRKAEITALFHDIGRLYQIDGYNIISSNKFEHGNIGFNILKEEGIDDIAILLAVKYHNKYALSGLYKDKLFMNLDDNTKFLVENVAKIIRDADKLQNIEYMIFNENKLFSKWVEKAFDKNFGNNQITKKCLLDFKNKKQIKFNDLNSVADHFLLMLSWIFDINFETTKKFLEQIKFKDFMIKKLKELGVDKNIIDNLKVIIH